MVDSDDVKKVLRTRRTEMVGGKKIRPANTAVLFEEKN